MITRLQGLVSGLRAAARASGRSLASIVQESLALRLSPARLGVSEYLDFRLYEQDLTAAQKRAFGGYRAQAVLEDLLIDDYSLILSLDKATFYALMRGYGLAVPETRATYAPGRSIALGEMLASVGELAAFLRSAALPLYLKPAYGAYGRGNASVEAIEGDQVLLGNGARMDIEAFCASLDDRAGFGWLAQESLRSHPAIAERCGPKISGVRLHTFLTPSGPRILRAIWKVNVGARDSDNFEHGRSGNLLARVDEDSGKVLRVVSGVGVAQVVDPPHPVTGASLVDFTLPDWPGIRELACRAATVFPGFICPGWDIALSDRGPRILEVNSFGDIDLSQHAYRRGFIDSEFVELLAQRGLASLLDGPARRTQRAAGNGRLGRRKAHWPW